MESEPEGSATIWSGPVRAEHPALEGDLRVDVAVVGAGITGLTLGWLLQHEGRSVAIVDAEAAGAGASGATSGIVTSVLDVSYRTLRERLGADRAGLLLAGAEAALELVRSLGQGPVPCAFEMGPAYVYSESSKDQADLEAELEAARELGVAVSLAAANPLPFPVAAALAFPRQAIFDPMQYLRGLTGLFTAAGGRIFESTRVTSFAETDDAVVLETPGGVLTAAHAVLATHSPIGINLLQTEMAPYRSYLLAYRTRSPLGEGAFWDTATPYYHYLRRVRSAGESLVLLGGADHKAGQESDPFERYRSLEDFARRRFREVEVVRRWSAVYYEPADGLPYVGRSPLAHRVLVGTGYSGSGLVLGTLAARLLTDLILGRPESDLAEIVKATRLPSPAAIGRAALDNLGVAARFVGDRAAGGERSLAEVGAGGGALVDGAGETLAVCRDGRGELHAVSAVCTHMGCLVNWNEIERTWDCPCHGGRFTALGRVLSGPPLRDLEPRPLPSASAQKATSEEQEEPHEEQ